MLIRALERDNACAWERAQAGKLCAVLIQYGACALPRALLMSWTVLAQHDSDELAGMAAGWLLACLRAGERPLLLAMRATGALQCLMNLACTASTPAHVVEAIVLQITALWDTGQPSEALPAQDLVAIATAPFAQQIHIAKRKKPPRTAVPGFRAGAGVPTQPGWDPRDPGTALRGPHTPALLATPPSAPTLATLQRCSDVLQLIAHTTAGSRVLAGCDAGLPMLATALRQPVHPAVQLIVLSCLAGMLVPRSSHALQGGVAQQDAGRASFEAGLAEQRAVQRTAALLILGAAEQASDAQSLTGPAAIAEPTPTALAASSPSATPSPAADSPLLHPAASDSPLVAPMAQSASSNGSSAVLPVYAQPGLLVSSLAHGVGRLVSAYHPARDVVLSDDSDAELAIVEQHERVRTGRSIAPLRLQSGAAAAGDRHSDAESESSYAESCRSDGGSSVARRTTVASGRRSIAARTAHTAHAVLRPRFWVRLGQRGQAAITMLGGRGTPRRGTTLPTAQLRQHIATLLCGMIHAGLCEGVALLCAHSSPLPRLAASVCLYILTGQAATCLPPAWAQLAAAHAELTALATHPTLPSSHATAHVSELTRAARAARDAAITQALLLRRQRFLQLSGFLARCWDAAACAGPGASPPWLQGYARRAFSASNPARPLPLRELSHIMTTRAPRIATPGCRPTSISHSQGGAAAGSGHDSLLHLGHGPARAAKHASFHLRMVPHDAGARVALRGVSSQDASDSDAASWSSCCSEAELGHESSEGSPPGASLGAASQGASRPSPPTELDALLQQAGVDQPWPAACAAHLQATPRLLGPAFGLHLQGRPGRLVWATEAASSAEARDLPRAADDSCATPTCQATHTGWHSMSGAQRGMHFMLQPEAVRAAGLAKTVLRSLASVVQAQLRVWDDQDGSLAAEAAAAKPVTSMDGVASLPYLYSGGHIASASVRIADDMVFDVLTAGMQAQPRGPRPWGDSDSDSLPSLRSCSSTGDDSASEGSDGIGEDVEALPVLSAPASLEHPLDAAVATYARTFVSVPTARSGAQPGSSSSNGRRVQLASTVAARAFAPTRAELARRRRGVRLDAGPGGVELALPLPASSASASDAATASVNGQYVTLSLGTLSAALSAAAQLMNEHGERVVLPSVAVWSASRERSSAALERINTWSTTGYDWPDQSGRTLYAVEQGAGFQEALASSAGGAAHANPVQGSLGSDSTSEDDEVGSERKSTRHTRTKTAGGALPPAAVIKPPPPGSPVLSAPHPSLARSGPGLPSFVNAMAVANDLRWDSLSAAQAAMAEWRMDPTRSVHEQAVAGTKHAFPVLSFQGGRAQAWFNAASSVVGLGSSAVGLAALLACADPAMQARSPVSHASAFQVLLQQAAQYAGAEGSTPARQPVSHAIAGAWPAALRTVALKLDMPMSMLAMTPLLEEAFGSREPDDVAAIVQRLSAAAKSDALPGVTSASLAPMLSALSAGKVKAMLKKGRASVITLTGGTPAVDTALQPLQAEPGAARMSAAVFAARSAASRAHEAGSGEAWSATRQGGPDDSAGRGRSVTSGARRLPDTPSGAALPAGARVSPAWDGAPHGAAMAMFYQRSSSTPLLVAPRGGATPISGADLAPPDEIMDSSAAGATTLHQFPIPLSSIPASEQLGVLNRVSMVRAALRRAAAAVARTRVCSTVDWQDWDWDAVAEVLDVHATSPEVLAVMLGADPRPSAPAGASMQQASRLTGGAALSAEWSEFAVDDRIRADCGSGTWFQRLGAFFALRAEWLGQGVSTGTRALDSAASAAQRSRNASPGGDELPSRQSSGTYSPAVPPAFSSSKPDINPYAEAGSASGRGFADLPWSPAALRFLRIARQWLLLLLAHPAGRSLLSEPMALGVPAKEVGKARQRQGFDSNDIARLMSSLFHALQWEAIDSSSLAPEPGLSAEWVLGLPVVHADSAASKVRGTMQDLGASAVLGSWERSAAMCNPSPFSRARFDMATGRELLALMGVLSSHDEGRRIMLALSRDNFGAGQAVFAALSRRELLRARCSGDSSTGRNREESAVLWHSPSAVSPLLPHMREHLPASVTASMHSFRSAQARKSVRRASANMPHPLLGAQTPPQAAPAVPVSTAGDDAAIAVQGSGSFSDDLGSDESPSGDASAAPSPSQLDAGASSPAHEPATSPRKRTLRGRQSSALLPTRDADVLTKTVLPLGSMTSKGYLARAMLCHMDYSHGTAAGRAVVASWCSSSATDPELRLYTLGFCRVLLRCGVPEWSSWVVDTLVSALNLSVPAASRQVAASVLTEAADRHTVYRRAIIARRPTLKHLRWSSAARLAEALVCEWDGVQWLAETGLLAKLVEEWSVQGGLARHWSARALPALGRAWAGSTALLASTWRLDNAWAHAQAPELPLAEPGGLFSTPSDAAQVAGGVGPDLTSPRHRRSMSTPDIAGLAHSHSSHRFSPLSPIQGSPGTAAHSPAPPQSRHARHRSSNDAESIALLEAASSDLTDALADEQSGRPDSLAATARSLPRLQLPVPDAPTARHVATPMPFVTPVWLPAPPGVPRSSADGADLWTLCNMPWRVEVWASWIPAGSGASVRRVQLPVDTWVDFSSYQPEPPRAGAAGSTRAFRGPSICAAPIDARGQRALAALPADAQLAAVLCVGPNAVDLTNGWISFDTNTEPASSARAVMHGASGAQLAVAWLGLRAARQGAAGTARVSGNLAPSETDMQRWAQRVRHARGDALGATVAGASGLVNVADVQTEVDRVHAKLAAAQAALAASMPVKRKVNLAEQLLTPEGKPKPSKVRSLGRRTGSAALAQREALAVSGIATSAAALAGQPAQVTAGSEWLQRTGVRQPAHIAGFEAPLARLLKSGNGAAANPSPAALLESAASVQATVAAARAATVFLEPAGGIAAPAAAATLHSLNVGSSGGQRTSAWVGDAAPGVPSTAPSSIQVACSAEQATYAQASAAAGAAGSAPASLVGVVHDPARRKRPPVEVLQSAGAVARTSRAAVVCSLTDVDTGAAEPAGAPSSPLEQQPCAAPFVAMRQSVSPGFPGVSSAWEQTRAQSHTDDAEQVHVVPPGSHASFTFVRQEDAVYLRTIAFPLLLFGNSGHAGAAPAHHATGCAHPRGAEQAESPDSVGPHLAGALAASSLGRRALLASGWLQTALQCACSPQATASDRRTALCTLATVAATGAGWRLLCGRIAPDFAVRMDQLARGCAAAGAPVRSAAVLVLGCAWQHAQGRADVSALGWAAPTAWGSSIAKQQAIEPGTLGDPAPLTPTVPGLAPHVGLRTMPRVDANAMAECVACARPSVWWSQTDHQRQPGRGVDVQYDDPHGGMPQMPMPSPSSRASKVLAALAMLQNAVSAGAGKRELLALRAADAAVFRAPEVMWRAHAMLGASALPLRVRRFVWALLDNTSLSSRAWSKVHSTVAEHCAQL